MLLGYVDYTISTWTQKYVWLSWNAGSGAYDCNTSSISTPNSGAKRYAQTKVGVHNNDGAITIFHTSTNSSDSTSYVRLGTVSGSGTSTAISWGSEVTAISNGSGVLETDYNSASGKFIIVSRTGSQAKRREGTYSGTTITWDSSQVTDVSSGVVYHWQMATSYRENSAGGNKTGLYVIPYKTDGGNTGVGNYYIRQLLSTTKDPNRYIGMAKQTYTNGQTATVNVIGNSTTGSSLTPNTTYYISDTGTITATETDIAIGKAYSSTKILLNR